MAESVPPTPDQILAIPDALREQLQQRVIDPTQSREQRLERLADFLFHEDGLGMTYEYDASYTVAEAFQTRRANCLTFTLLTVALAREAGLEAYGQQIEETLSWRQEANTVYRTNHVNAGVRIYQRKLSVDVAQDSVIARNPPERIADNRLLAHYYNNRAAELLAEGRMDAAWAYSVRSLELDPDYATSWSNAGVVQLRMGHGDEAERYYLHALSLQPSHEGTLFNLAAYYQRSEQTRKAASINRRLNAVQARDPFFQYVRASEYERQGNYADAVKYYKRAIDLYAGEHRFHFGLARAYLLMGDTRRASHALVRASELSQGEARQHYQAKLDTLRKRLN
ncbi:transglutaminase [Pseudoxanthomonas kalamensis DSM 18571]|uniref:transglutaminase-like domain-containing protein n=1 Tax=Pseudoxanthomonas kalamensis TaxID=289483 RepID=UPI001390C7F8|nr:transglutaminase-like domain-containing protein [Pseudoxanthomonas kalamensis]KAF1710079.1 transglutaminase [Pseudoxanthomonas kalamensis DSM 18571]